MPNSADQRCLKREMHYSTTRFEAGDTCPSIANGFRTRSTAMLWQHGPCALRVQQNYDTVSLFFVSPLVMLTTLLLLLSSIAVFAVDLLKAFCVTKKVGATELTHRAALHF